MTGTTGTVKRRYFETATDNGFDEVATFAQHSIELTKGQRGEYGWSIKLYFDDNGKEGVVVDYITAIDKLLQQRYGSRPKGEEPQQ